MSPDRQEVTKLLQQWKAGDSEALDQLMPIVYDELRRLAARCLRSERQGHTLRATALVNEAYLRLMDADVGWQDRAHFYAVAARVVRRILVEYARQHGRQKRGGGEIPIPLDEAVMVGPEAASTVLDLDEALQRLATLDARKSEIIQRGIELDAPLHLTWSCYQGEDLACGVCDSCVLRLRAFEQAGRADPIAYRSQVER